jgi:hypothetical protein
MMTIVNAPNPMDNCFISQAWNFMQQAPAAGLTNGILYVCVNPGDGVWQMMPSSEWGPNNLDPLFGSFFATFGKPPTSTAWGNYYQVPELIFYMKQGKTLASMGVVNNA